MVLVFDMTNANSFEGVLKWYKQIREAKDCPLILVGNKADKVGEVIMTADEMLEISNYCAVPCYQVSAQTGQGVDEAFMSIIQMGYTR